MSNSQQGRKRPLEQAERRRIVYFLKYAEEASFTAAARRFRRDESFLRRIAREEGIDLKKFVRA